MEKDDDIKAAVRKHRVLRLLYKSLRLDIVESFLPSRDNYVKAICSFKEKFGRKDLLIQFFIRESLQLVTDQEVKIQSVLYGKLESQLHALDTLDIMSDNYATILFPLVETCLSLEILRHWERVNSDFDVPLKEQLDSLIVFVRREVRAVERVALANASPNTPRLRPNKRRRIFPNKTDCFVTTSDLANVYHTEQYPFCTGYHGSAILRKALNMFHDEKRMLLSQACCFFACAERANLASRCRDKIVLSTGVVAAVTLFGWILMGTKKKPPVTCCSTNLAPIFTMTYSRAHRSVKTRTHWLTLTRHFLQIAFHLVDCDYLKFLWWTAGDELMTLKHSYVVFGVTCSPFLLGAVLDCNLSRFLVYIIETCDYTTVGVKCSYNWSSSASLSLRDYWVDYRADVCVE
ncbi:hypothetical protein PR048_016348 [Dryococelus australis]|uniref:Uncharacterized protein n=1 Tax=Dryococelus australis TaxID=614101 RepID=A0ABQ9HJG6_9NEOP|nr:hypothetical protein PR048_016348 [Dryococelus australis]